MASGGARLPDFCRSELFTVVHGHAVCNGRDRKKQRHASTVTIDPDTGRTSACHDVPPRLKAEIVGTVMYERKSMAARQRTRATAEFMPHQRTDS